MKERPILFSGPMVRAILGGRKKQTRRAIKPQPEYPTEYVQHLSGEWWHPCVEYGATEYGIEYRPTGENIKCPHGQPGDRLWVRETFALHHNFPDEVFYWADKEISGQKWTPSIFMPRWASRITLQITDIRVERLRDISENDAAAEGVKYEETGFSARVCFVDLWQQINGKRPGCSWDDNPWVWVVEFEKID